MPFYAYACPRGHKGKWTHKAVGQDSNPDRGGASRLESRPTVMGPDFDPLALTPEQRPEYGYEGPEVIYTFWSKTGRPGFL